MKRLLITGGTGLIGRALVRLAMSDYDVHVLSRTPIVQAGILHHAVDLTNDGAVRQVIETVKPDAIIHLAAAGVTGNLSTYDLWQVNVMGLASILGAAADLERAPSVVTAGSWFEYADVGGDNPLRENHPLSTTLPYSASKIAATTLAEHYAQWLPMTVLRVFSVYGVGERLPRLVPYIIHEAQAGRAIELTAAEQVRDYVFADDVARGFLQAVEHPATVGACRVLNLGTGQGVVLRDFIEMVGDVLQKYGVSADFRFGAKPYRANERMSAIADVTQMRAALGWQPETPLTIGLDAVVRDVLQLG